MIRVSRMQNLLGAMTTSRVAHHPVQMVSTRLNSEANIKPALPTQVGQPVADAPQAPAAWDPHEVWLHRVKKPREQRQA
jgi:hypothetical protein